jgi:hypothetical protein
MLRVFFRADADPNLIFEAEDRDAVASLRSLFTGLASKPPNQIEVVGLPGIDTHAGLTSLFLASDAGEKRSTMRWQESGGWRVSWSANPEVWIECSELNEGLGTPGTFQFLCYDASHFGVAVCFGLDCHAHF